MSRYVRKTNPIPKRLNKVLFCFKNFLSKLFPPLRTDPNDVSILTGDT